MKLLSILFLLLFLISGASSLTIKEQQIKCTRVKDAYASKLKLVDKTLAEYHISHDKLRIYMRAFKSEKKIELWAKNNTDTAYVLIKTFTICEISGNLGPKRRSGDLQVPEGFYHISGMNPYSKYYLSMKINYPNESDKVRGVKGHLGNEIFIHGDCVSSGCIAITNDRIKELYVFCLEAYNSGQENIAITIFPTEMNNTNYSKLTSRYSKHKDKLSLWIDLKKGYDLFNQTKKLPRVKFLENGTHEVS